MSHGVIPGGIAEGARGGLAPIARRLAAVGVTANHVTFLGFALSVIGADMNTPGDKSTDDTASSRLQR